MSRPSTSSRRCELRILIVGLLLVVTGAACRSAGTRARVISFDPHRRLSPASARALAAVSGPTTVVPPGLADADLMGSMTTPDVGFVDAGEQATFRVQRDRARRAATKYARAAAAAHDGYVLTSYFVRDFGVHWINWSLVTKPFNPATPAMLLYDGEGTDAHLVGLSYYLRSLHGVPPEGFAGANDRWHRHFGACYAGGFIIGEGVMTRDDCTKRCDARARGAIRAPVGTQAEIPEMERYTRTHSVSVSPHDFCALVPGDDVWMLHLWVAPGTRNPNGQFSTLNPRVSTCRGACRTLG